MTPFKGNTTMHPETLQATIISLLMLLKTYDPFSHLDNWI